MNGVADVEVKRRDSESALFPSVLAVLLETPKQRLGSQHSLRLHHRVNMQSLRNYVWKEKETSVCRGSVGKTGNERKVLLSL